MALITDEAQPCDIKHIEYFKDQHLFQIVYENSIYDDKLVTHDFSGDAAKTIEDSPAIMVAVIAQKGEEPYGYHVPLKHLDQ